MEIDTRTIHSNENGEVIKSRSHLLFTISGIAALFAGALFTTAIINPIFSILQPGYSMGWSALFQSNWLIEIFKIHARFSGVTIDVLHVLNYLDISILALVGTMGIGLYALLRRTSKTWCLIGVVQPYLGIVLFMATRSAGRSAVMGAGLVFSIVMLRNQTFPKMTAYVGILASVFLLVGDFSAGLVYSSMITALVGIGYILLILWICLIARILFNFGQNKKG